MHSYNDGHNSLPPAEARWEDTRTGQPGYPVSWRVRLLPYLDESSVFYDYHMDEPWDGPHNSQLLAHMPKFYALPNAGRETLQGYTYFRVFISPRNNPLAHPAPAFMGGDEGQGVPLHSGFPDGVSNTILVVEAAEAVPWTKPDELICDPEQPLSPLGDHFLSSLTLGLNLGGRCPRGFTAAMADGSVRFIRQDIKESTLRALITRNGGEVSNDPD